MKDNVRKSKKQIRFFVSVAWCLLISSVLTAPTLAQLNTNPLIAEPDQNNWRAPDLAALPADWWSQLNSGSKEEDSRRFGLFLDALRLRVSGLVGDELTTALNSIGQIDSGLDLLVLARVGPTEERFEPPLSKESYFIDDVLDLRAQWRELEVHATQLQLQMDQSARQIRLLEALRDKLIRDYGSANPDSPARMLTGIKRIAARIEYELVSVRIKISESILKQIEVQTSLLGEQQDFARGHLVTNDITLDEIESAVDDARAKVTEMSEKLAATQMQMLDAFSADESKPSLSLLREQQMTRASSEAELADLQELLLLTKFHWYQLRADKLDSGYDLQAAMVNSRRTSANALKKVELWSSISQTTLITPSSDTSLNTIKNYEIAQSVARDTLAVLGQINSTSDSLLIVQDILTKELISNRSGLGSAGARLGLVFGNTWDRLVDLSDFHLFNIGDTAVTPVGIVKMMFILALAFCISWLIRFLLARGLRNKRASQSPAFYTLGRILHYITILAGSFAALGSIGIDFASFALIAGALSVGIGFGLQAIVSNFVSGLILLFEGTLRVGDYIELDSGLCGVVKEINTRATLVHTNDSVDVVVPNSELVTTKLTNWTLRETVARMRIPFGVAYGSDKELVRKLALEATEEVEFALHKMPGREPQIRLSSFGDNALEFEAFIWVSRQGVRRPLRIRADFLWALETLLRENNVEIPFPQRDLHVRSDFRVQGDQSPDDVNSDELKPTPGLPST